MTPTPLDNLPFNTLKAYVMGTTHSGCEVYMPTVSDNAGFMEVKRKQLQKFLNEQDVPSPPPIEPMRA